MKSFSRSRKMRKLSRGLDSANRSAHWGFYDGGEVEVVLTGEDDFVGDAVLRADDDVTVGYVGTVIVEGAVAVVGQLDAACGGEAVEDLLGGMAVRE